MRSLEEMQKLFSQRGYTLLDKQYTNNKQYLTFEKDGYFYYNTYNGFIKTNNFKKWGQNNPYSIINLRHFLEDENVSVVIPEQNYDYDNLQVICNCGQIYKVKWDNFIKSKQYQCPKCGRNNSAKHHIKDNYLLLMKEKGLIPIESYKGCKVTDYYKTQEGYIIKTSLYNIARGANLYDTMFDICNIYSLDNIHLFVQQNYEGVKFLSNTYIGSKNRYKFKCVCGRTFETIWQLFYYGDKTRCDYCTHTMSSLAQKTEEWLERKNIVYIKEKTYQDCRYKGVLRFDYYLPQYNKLIEIDGKQHEQPVCFGGISQEEAIKNLEQTQIRDKIKDEYCLQHDIPLLRIKDKDFKNNEYEIKLQIFIS